MTYLLYFNERPCNDCSCACYTPVNAFSLVHWPFIILHVVNCIKIVLKKSFRGDEKFEDKGQNYRDTSLNVLMLD